LNEERMHELAAEFLAADIDRCFRYFVARDISELVGSGYLPTVSQAEEFAREVGVFSSRATVGAICADDESRIQDAVRLSGDQERLAVDGELLKQGIDRSLERISVASGREGTGRSHARGSAGPPGDDDDAAHTPALRLIDDDQREPGRDYLRVYSLEAAAGYFGEGQPVESLGYVQAPPGLRLCDGLFVVRIRGRSMEPRIPDGRYAVFRTPVVGSRQGKIVLAQRRGYHDPDTGGSYTVKRYESAKTVSEDEWSHTMIRLVPENPEYEPIEIRGDSADELAIIAEFVTLMYE
jgi:phage repressor protein C with HTH and peptisase S24 domain